MRHIYCVTRCAVTQCRKHCSSNRCGPFSEEGNTKLRKHPSNKYLFSQEGAEKQAQLERSLREKAAVEKELEKVSFSPQGTYLS